MSIPPGFSGYGSSNRHSPRPSSSRQSSVRPSATPQLSPALEVNLRKVRWGEDQVFSQSQREDEEEDDEDVKDELEEDAGWNGHGSGVTLAITAARGKVGCCYYDGGVGKVYFLQDQGDSERWDLVTMILEQVKPSTVLTSAAADPSFLTTLATILESLPSSLDASTAASSSGEEVPLRLEYRPQREFYQGQGRTALAQLTIVEGGRYRDGVCVDDEGDDGMDGQRDAYSFGKRRNRGRTEMQGDQERRNGELRLESFLNGLDGSALTLGCAASLLGHIARSNTAGGELRVEEGLEVAGVELMQLDQVMHINAEALASLQIFNDELHASRHSNKTKEGLSLFGILNIARTTLGRILMRQWFLRPTLDLDIIQSRHTAIECFSRNENQHIADALQSNFRGIKNAPKTVRVLAIGKGGLKEWQAIWQFLYSAIMVRDAALNLSSRAGVEIVDKLLASIDAEEFKELGGMINDIIDWEESTLQKGRICVKSGVDLDLDEMRRTYHGLSSLLSKVAVELSYEIPRDFAESLSVVYFPQLGYLITIPYKVGVRTPENFAVEGWEFQFVTEASAYYKSDKCRDLDHHIGDIHSFIMDKEIEILHVLLGQVLKQADHMSAACESLAELDCLLAFAEVARIYNWKQPTMTEASVCKIRQGRHPLVELCVDAFVPNDSSLVSGRGVGWNGEEEMEVDADDEYIDPNMSMLIVTGANYSGKSIFLKQIALLTFMAHLGSFIPAEAALIGLTDRIFTRISTRESITRGSSAFMIDLQQISFALRNATSRSLIIIDEFGKGTESDDGAGLFCGVVEHLIRRGAEAPRVAVATHFQDVFANGLLSRSLPIGLAHMEILLHKTPSLSSSSSSSSSQVTYLYRSAASPSLRATLTLHSLSSGLASSSHAAACASLFGIDAATVERATQISDLLARFEMDKIVGAELGEEERQDLEESEEVARRFLEWEIGGEAREVDELVRRIGEVLRLEE